MLGLMRIIANRTDVIGHEPCLGLRYRIIGHNGIIRFSKARSMNEGEVTHIEKAFYLTSFSGVYVDTIGQPGEVVTVFPLPYFWTGAQPAVNQTTSNQAIAA